MKKNNCVFPQKNMNQKVLKAFIELANTGNFQRAAERLCVTQSTLTKQIQALEAELGLDLFSRIKSGTILNKNGHLLFNEINNILTAYDLLKNKANTLTNPNNLSVAFGMATRDLAPALINNFMTSHPQKNITLIDLPTAAQSEKLLAGELDLAFMREQSGTFLKQMVVRRDRLLLIYHQSQKRLMEQQNIIDILSNNIFLCIDENICGGTYNIISTFLKNTVATANLKEISSYPNILSLVKENFGCALIPESACHHNEHKDILSVPINNPLTIWNIVMAWNERFNNTLRDEFIDYCHEVITTTSGRPVSL
ncbi:hypothetical protein CHU32_11540 [Superficieibacter electus]|uniref:HTH lysR-type domain-containing protein n=1 Tax=Superficieibacter electus TaxID=2022662 RepID=A0A2P5GQB2_9ENTR|nr:LysR family transcriptional regulator [Superficieibacter electus]POP45584.1 hypothetical protein CHU33_08610 [Superficieibacter electus]POP48745.1 hypothetical protein CHU32_11540 [Superficieibacter electus]